MLGPISLLGLLGFAIVPYAFLLGLVRTRYSAAGAVGELIERLNTPDRRVTLREALANALGDTLAAARLLARVGRALRDPRGPALRAARAGLRAARWPRSSATASSSGRSSTTPRCATTPSLVRAAAAAAALQLENERLEAELRARVEELQTSRARLVDVSMFERRRLERDLHDGAQQRLVSLSLQLGLAQRKLEADPAGAGRLLEAARDELTRALEELRELARGIHPAVLTDRGLEAALEALADRAPLPVDLEAMPTDRLPAAVEAAAYFVVAESLANVARYAQRGARQRAHRTPRRLCRRGGAR